jgi:ribonuclease Z
MKKTYHVPVLILGRQTLFLLMCLFLFSAHASAEVVEKYKQGMHVVMTGTGSAFPDPQRAGASVAVIVDGTILQFDFGRGVMENMMLADINPLDVDYVFFTHHHFDHIASYDYFVISAWIGARQKPVRVFGAPGTQQMHDGAVNKMHASDYEFVQFITENWPPSINLKPTKEPPFQVNDVMPGVIIDTEKFKVTAVSTPHYPSKDKLSLGYRVDTKYGSVVISGDTGPSKALTELAMNADLLIHELVKPDPGMLKGGKFASKDFQKDAKRDFNKSQSKRPQTGHTSPSDLGKLANAANVKRLVAYHLAPYSSVDKAIEMVELYTGPRPGPHIWAEMTHAVKKYYRGPFVLAEDGMIFTISN